MGGEVERALSEIAAIRGQIAAGTAFRGYGPAAVAATGGLALATWAAQSAGLVGTPGDPVAYVAAWGGTAVAATGLVAVEMRARARREHHGLADEMVAEAAGRFVPAGVAGCLLALVFLRLAPDASWTLPGLWQVLVALGVFASVRSLPGNVSLVGAWYLVCGLGALAAASVGREAEPWMMGAPFAAGQLLMAFLLHRAGEDGDAA
jgi:hypothetical protein